MVMRKLLFILTGAILVVGLVSCEKQNTNPQGKTVGNDGVVKSEMVTVNTPSGPDFDPETGPWLIRAEDGKDRGGNRTCADVLAAFPNSFKAGDFTDCGEKVDIDDDYVGEVNGFPFPVWVNGDGSIGFSSGDRDCLVKAVIVKGSNNANVYIYPGGTTGENGLASPAFDDGRIPWVSNVTFCCACDEQEEELFYAVKIRYGDEDRWAVSNGGTPYYSETGRWCDYLVIGDYPDDVEMDLYDEDHTTIVGDVTVDASGDITITVDGYNLNDAHLYVGDLNDIILDGFGCPIYDASPWISALDISDPTATSTHTFFEGTDF